MKMIRKLKLPRWVISRIPYEKEDETIGSIIAPMVLFPLMGIVISWYDLYNPKWVLVEIIVAILLISATIILAWWMLERGDMLKADRRNLMFDYDFTKNSEKKEQIKVELKKLLSNVDYLKFLCKVAESSEEKEQIKGELKKLLSNTDYLIFLYEIEENPHKKEEIRYELRKLFVFVK